MPFSGESPAEYGVVEAEMFLFDRTSAQIPGFCLFGNVVEAFRHYLLEGELADVMQQPGCVCKLRIDSA